MKKWIPDTRTYYRHLLDLETDEGKREVIQQKILSIKRTSERDYISDLTYYHHKKRYGQDKGACPWNGMTADCFPCLSILFL